MLIKGLAKSLRCAYCHDEACGLLEGCAECGVLLHTDCRQTLGRCPTLGCESPSLQAAAIFVASEGPRPSPARPLSPPRLRLQRFWRASRGFLLTAVLLGGASEAVRHELRTSARASQEQAGEQALKQVRAASYAYQADLGRWPATLAELYDSRDPRWQGPYLAANQAPAAHPYEIMWRGEEAWLAVEVRSEGRTPVLKLLAVLFQRGALNHPPPLDPDGQPDPTTSAFRAQKRALGRVARASHNYRIDVGFWPETLAELYASKDPSWRGPYLSSGEAPAARPYEIMWRGEEAWLAVEVSRGAEPVLKLLGVLFRRGALNSPPPLEQDSR